MLKSVMAHYDGSNYITDGNLAIKKNQRVIITVLDDFISEDVAAANLSVSATLDSLTGILKGSDFTSIKEIKEARIAERYGI